jgi:hypothetical protein
MLAMVLKQLYEFWAKVTPVQGLLYPIPKKRHWANVTLPYIVL